jgi:hypothetical protein
MPTSSTRIFRHALLLAVSLFVMHPSATLVFADEANEFKSIQHFLEKNCLDCHSGSKPSGDFSVDSLQPTTESIARPSFSSLDYERIVRKMRAGQMPPPDADRPDEAETNNALRTLEKFLDSASGVAFLCGPNGVDSATHSNGVPELNPRSARFGYRRKRFAS